MLILIVCTDDAVYLVEFYDPPRLRNTQTAVQTPLSEAKQNGILTFRDPYTYISISIQERGGEHVAFASSITKS